MPALLLLIAFFGAWQIYCDAGDVEPLVLPSPSDIATSLFDDRSLLFDQLLVTAREIALGMSAAVVVALLFAVLMHRYATLRRAIYPLAIASQTIPIPAIAPLLVLWWGFGSLPKIFVIALICFFPILVPELDRLRGVEPGLIKLMQTIGATRWQRLRLV
jgi:NitT/TauT family transport system permease protein/putative hydroxymethylpyrimidine transport system permease protein